MGMSKVHLCMDMQLYAVTQQVCWYKTDEFKNVVIHPDGMHIIQSFLSCISKLMKGSGLETYVAAAYGGLTGIFNGKSWVKAIQRLPYSKDLYRAYRNRLDDIYTTEESQQQSSQKQHKEELLHRRKLDAKDRAGIETEVNKYPHPLEDARPYLYNPVSGQIASADVNVADSQILGDQLERNYISSLPGVFYNVISSPIRTMGSSKKQTKGTKNNPVIDFETIFLRLLLIGQQRQLDLGPLFSYELCAVPPALIDEYSCLRKGNKSGLVKRLGVLEMNPYNPDMVIVDVSQLFYHIVWPFGGKPSDLVESIKERLTHYPNESKKVIVFDKYENISAKDHERKRRADEVVINYELSISSKLPKRDAIMKNKLNKRQLGSVLCTFDFGDGVTTDSSDDYVFGHDEADITMVSYVLDAANKGHKIVHSFEQ